MGNYIKQNLMQPTPSVADQEKMRMCKPSEEEYANGQNTERNQ
jgi:hypothetical protein